MGSKKLTGAIIGAGFMGQEHLQNSMRIKDISIIGIVDSNKDKGETLAHLANCKWYENLEKLYEDVTPDYVDVCLPSGLHKEAAEYAMKHGSHILVEKPFALTLDDIDSMINVSVSTRKRLMVAHVCRFMPQYLFAHEVIDDKRYGEVISVTLFRDSSTPKWSWNNWLHDKTASGGTIMDLSIHDIDLANWLLGSPVMHQAYETTTPDRKGVSEVVSILGYPNGVFAKVSANHLMPDGFPLIAGYKVLFEKAEIEWQSYNSPNGCVTVFDEGGKKDVNLKNYYPDKDDNPYCEELKTFASCILNDTVFPISPDEARLAVSTILDLTGTIKKL